MTTMLTETAPAVIEKPKEAQILERAADLLEEFGWCRNALCRKENDSDGPSHTGNIHAEGIIAFCAMGAVWRAAADLGYVSPRWEDIRAIAKAEGLLGHETFYIVTREAGIGVKEFQTAASWNDMNCGSAQEAAAVLRERARRSPVGHMS